MKTRAATKSTKKPVRKSATKETETRVTARNASSKSVKTSSKSAPRKAAAKTAKPAKKTPLKKPVAAKKATAAAVREAGTAKGASGAKSKPVKISAAKKPAKTVRKPAQGKTPILSGKRAQVTTGRIPAPARAETKVTEKKLKTATSVRAEGKKTAAKVPAVSPRKTGVKEKAPAGTKKAAAGKMVRTTKRPPAAGMEKKPANAVSGTKRSGEPKPKKVPAKTAAEKTAPSEPAVKTVRKTAALRPTGEKYKKPAAKREATPSRAGAEPVEGQNIPSPRKVTTQRKARPAAGKAAMTKITAAAKIPAVKKETSVRAKAAGKLHEAAKKTGGKEPAVSPAARSERPLLKIFLPGREVEEEYLRESTGAGLPEEYGENALIAMAVDPNTIFVDWEIVPGEIAGKEGELTLRFHDTTGVEFDGGNANAITDISVARRVGNGFFVINMPGRDVIVEAGIIGSAGFHAVVRSDVVSFPFLLSFDDLGIVQKLLAAGIPVGY